jgi:hypothetical protein
MSIAELALHQVITAIGFHKGQIRCAQVLREQLRSDGDNALAGVFDALPELGREAFVLGYLEGYRDAGGVEPDEGDVPPNDLLDRLLDHDLAEPKRVLLVALEATEDAHEALAASIFAGYLAYCQKNGLDGRAVANERLTPETLDFLDAIAARADDDRTRAYCEQFESDEWESFLRSLA